MHPSAARSSRSSLQSPGPSSSPSLIHQQQQHILYGPITNLQPCTTPLHPPLIYPTTQCSTGPPSPASLQTQGKSTKWQSKTKAPRGQYCHNQPAQQLSYTPKPLVLFDQSKTTPPPATSSFVVASSTFAHGPFPTEHYNHSSVALIPQPYFKQPEVQTFCLVQDRQPTQQHNSYYNISATNTCSLQAVNANSTFQLPSLAPYAVTAFPNNPIPSPISVQSTPIYQTAPIGLVFAPPPRDKHSTNSPLDMPALKCVRNKIPMGNGKVQSSPYMENDEWSTSFGASGLFSSGNTFESSKGLHSSMLQKPCSSTSKAPEERSSDESSTSFDFTIEAEKMVSALCNTASSNDLGGACRDGQRKTESGLFNGAGDNVSNKAAWYSDFSTDYSVNVICNCRSVATQTQNQSTNQQLPELIRKTAYWGCSEAETILNSDKYQGSKQTWLSNISSATRTAITKSSTCFPVFAGDGTFVQDLIIGLLRISNGWLVLDNYLNKQHYPNLTNRYDSELTRCFQGWEGSTYELLRNVIQTFLKLDENSITGPNATQESQNETSSSSFPGDVSLYTNCDFFNSTPSTFYQQSDNPLADAMPSQAVQESAYALHYAPLSSGAQNFGYFNAQQNLKETKLRRKWTITENLASAIDSTKSVPDVSLTHANVGVNGGKYRAKCSVSSAKGVSRQSLNTEFFNLKNKVMESTAESTKQWGLNANTSKKTEFIFERKTPSGIDAIHGGSPSIGMSPIYSSELPISTHEATYTTQCSPGIDPISSHSTTGMDKAHVSRCSSGMDTKYTTRGYAETEYRKKSLKRMEHNYIAQSVTGITSLHVGKSSNERAESAAIPRKKITLLSQIEPSTSINDKEPEEMTANLSAWFASMRHSNSSSNNIAHGVASPSESLRSMHPQELSRSTMDSTRQLQMDPNRQLQTLQNMQNIQSAPWNACNLINSSTNVQHVEEYDSSEDVRVYMKPGSYNVPKKRHQKRSNRRAETVSLPRNTNAAAHNIDCGRGKRIVLSDAIPASAIRVPFPATPIVPPPSFSLENSPRILRRLASSLSHDIPQDITWKAACASAEILLEALNVKDAEAVLSGIKAVPTEINVKTNVRDGGASSYEASEDDSGSTSRLSVSDIQFKESKNTKTNVKTDSWLIRTLNNASIKQRQEPDQESSESCNSSIHEDELLTGSTIVKIETSLGRSQESRNEERVKDSGEGVTRATYSETVRRSATGTIKKEASRGRPMKASACVGYSTILQTAGRKCQRKDGDRSFPAHKSRKSSGKRVMKDAEDGQSEGFVKSKISREEVTKVPAVKAHGKKKENFSGTFGENSKNKSGDRGWSVWYSSKRRQSLSPLASSKLDVIHQAVWQMDETHLFKYSPSSATVTHLSVGLIEDYYKVVKSPMSLETIGYKLKNRIYHKVEHVVRDFRRIVYNSKLCHKNDAERMAKIDALSRRLDELFEEHFANWDFENITGSPRDGNGSPIPARYKLPAQKVQRYSNTKKSISTSANAKNAALH